MKKLTKEEVKNGIIVALMEMERQRTAPPVDGRAILQKLLGGVKGAPNTLTIGQPQGQEGQMPPGQAPVMPPGGPIA